MDESVLLTRLHHPDTNPRSRLLPNTSTDLKPITKHVLLCGVGGLSTTSLQRIVAVLRAPNLRCVCV